MLPLAIRTEKRDREARHLLTRQELAHIGAKNDDDRIGQDVSHTSIDDEQLRHRRGAFEAGLSARSIAFNPLGLTSRPPLAGAVPSSASPTTVRGSLRIFFSLLIAAFLIFDLSDKAT
jgi:hypothetical protein